ncbi:MAG TPA: hypothetical protein VHL98_11145 [Microvirga sp.]|jgi:hypothetical protein|nr:hypothetical protein [Microvirga sp.]
MKLNDITVDAVKIEAGAWIGDIPEMGDLRLHVRGINNADYRRMQTKLLDAVPRAKRQGGRVDPDEQDRVTNQCLVATVLLGWENFEDQDGSIPFSREKARELLSDPRYRRFRDAVIWAAVAVGEAQAADLEADQGNSQAA